MSEGWFVIIGGAVTGFFALLAQWLTSRQEKHRWKTDAQRWRAEREFNTLGELGDALSRAASAFTTHPPPQDSALWAGYYFGYAAQLHDAIIKAAIYLPLTMQAQVKPLMDAYRAAIDAQIRGLKSGQGRASDPFFLDYTFKMTAFNLELKQLLLAEVPQPKRGWWRRRPKGLAEMSPPPLQGPRQTIE